MYYCSPCNEPGNPMFSITVIALNLKVSQLTTFQRQSTAHSAVTTVQSQQRFPSEKALLHPPRRSPTHVYRLGSCAKVAFHRVRAARRRTLPQSDQTRRNQRAVPYPRYRAMQAIEGGPGRRGPLAQLGVSLRRTTNFIYTIMSTSFWSSACASTVSPPRSCSAIAAVWTATTRTSIALVHASLQFCTS